MNIAVKKEMGRVEVAVLRVEGQLDGQSYQDLIAKAKEIYDAGGHDFLLDLTDLTYIITHTRRDGVPDRELNIGEALRRVRHIAGGLAATRHVAGTLPSSYA